MRGAVRYLLPIAPHERVANDGAGSGAKGRYHAQAMARRLRMGAETAKIGADSEVVREFHTDAV
jgi:hypothetical protein